ncbi:MAG: FkbM family methyltransferase [Planctomycetaceae bacterium]
MLIRRFLNSLPPDLSTSPVILDVGSCNGDQSCEFATQFPKAQIFAFEARPQSAQTVRRTVSQYPNIEVIESAVHDFDGETEFHVVNDLNPGASSLFVGSGVQDIHPIQQARITVPAMRLDTWAKQARVSRFDLVWMDLQGPELLALRGMGNMLRTVSAIQLEITYFELYSGQVMWPEVRDFLEFNGFRLVDEWPDICGYFGDAIFLRNVRAEF